MVTPHSGSRGVQQHGVWRHWGVGGLSVQPQQDEQAPPQTSVTEPSRSLALQPSQQWDELSNFLLKPPFKRNVSLTGLEAGSLRSRGPRLVSSEASVLGM